jgi:hypothetical protein
MDVTRGALTTSRQEVGGNPRGSNLRLGHGTGRKRSKALQDCAGGITDKFLILKESGEHNLHDGVLCPGDGAYPSPITGSPPLEPEEKPPVRGFFISGYE